MHRGRALLVTCATVFASAACGSDSTQTSTTTPTTATSTTAEPPATTATTSGGTSAPPASAPTGFATAPVAVAPSGAAGTALLTAVRAAAQSGFDRVTFEFANHLPGYRVGYVDRPIRQDGSGAEVAVEGTAVLEVQMSPASGADLSAGGTETYLGPDRLSPGTPTIVEVVRSGDFEGSLTWVIGATSASGFKVSTLDSPPRLVVDIKSG